MSYIFESENLMFRKFEKKDGKALYKYHRQPQLMKWIPNESYEDLDETLEAIEFYSDCVNKNKLPFVLAIELKENGKMIGDTGINEVDGKVGELEVGYSICEEYMGNGYATEAVRAITEFVKEHFNMKIVYGRVMSGNIASVRVMEKCGYKYIETEFDAEDDPYGKGMLVYKYDLENNCI